MLMGDLALINMALGNKAEALALAERAIAANPIEKDAITGPSAIEILARVAGANRRARPRDRRLAETTLNPGPSGPVDVPLTPALLRLDPMFDPLLANFKNLPLRAQNEGTL